MANIPSNPDGMGPTTGPSRVRDGKKRPKYWISALDLPLSLALPLSNPLSALAVRCISFCQSIIERDKGKKKRKKSKKERGGEEKRSKKIL